ncbi:nuclear transport factor 2 family protein [Actinotalea sp. K2]|uniref:nuclear transport factor 2 family protein n=1 Tax=Actinotalea sp. K2 TaxID=2939438 RepID=UPI0020179510|nr:nuclear transport factor 2 family protein [Actinotalea sp. K2]MCL3859485.1 nuclear transport factor 2 family protein [Actinotalea sp. K2]
MSTHDDVIGVERAGWRALATSGAAATSFYDEVLDDEVVMLLPGGLVLTERSQVVASMGGEPWGSYEIEDLEALEVGPDTVLVHYRVRATRGDEPAYSALVSSLYARRGAGWRLVAHQQTPR